jgi:Ni2+-binding GTPase involved in maturation of urease and hydrogenase
MLIKKTDKVSKRPVIIFLYGTPGSGKTSLANTAANPVLIDCDRGFDRAVNRQDTIYANCWEDVRAHEKDIKGYGTVIIDTAKAMLDDYLMSYVIKLDYNNKKNQLRAYGAIGNEFKFFVNERRAECIDIVVIAHAKEDKDGDTTKIYPDVTGQSKDLLLRIADQVGYMTVINNRRTIQFEPTEKTIGKNVAKLPLLEIPDAGDEGFDSFMANIIAKVKEAISTQTEAQRLTIETISSIQEDIAAMGTPSNADAIIELIAGANLGMAQTKALKQALLKKCTELGITYDKNERRFVLPEPAGPELTRPAQAEPNPTQPASPLLTFSS